MAGSKIKGIKIQLGADTRGLSTALKEIEAKAKPSLNELKEINRTIKQAPDSITAWKQKQDVLNKAISESKDKVKLLENAQEQVAKQLADGKISGEQYRAFERELENARSATTKLESELAGTTQQVKNLERGVDSSADTVRNASDGYSTFKNVLANLATQGINFAFDKLKIFTQQIIETGKAFESSLSNVSALSGATGDEMETLTEKAKQMGATTKYTASQTADAFGYMALAGWQTEDMLAGIDGVLNLASASNMDLARASDIVTDYLTAFGLTAQDSAKFVDQMSYAMSRSNTNTEQLGEAYKNCASTATSMGYSVEETTAVLMTMANAGVKGGEAGTALNAIMTRLATNTNGCASKLEEYGVKVYDTEGNMNSLASILESVSVAWKGFSDEQQASIAKLMAGTNHFSALQTIMNGLSDSAKASGSSFSDYAEALENCDGTAQKMADTMLDNLAGDMTILDSAIDGVKIALSDRFNPVIREIVQYITEKMPEIQEYAENASDKFMGVIEWCSDNLPEIRKHLEKLIPAVTGVASGFVALNTAKTTTKAVTGLVDVVKSLNTAMLANPATAVAVAIGALAIAIGGYCAQAETEVSELQKISEAVDEQYGKEHKQIDDVRESLNELNKKFNDSAEAVDKESERTEYLWQQLDKLTDSSGKVLSADKIRAEYILGELNKALGTEYELTGNQIQGYKDLQSEIEKTIAKKKAEAYFDAYLADSAEMAENKAETKEAYVTASKQRDEKREIMDNAKERFDESNSTVMETAEEIINYYDKYGALSVMSESEFEKYQKNGKWNTTRGRFTQEQLDNAKAYVTAKAEYADATSRQREAEADYNVIMQYFDKLDRAGVAMSEERFADVENILYNPQNLNEMILENATDFDEEVKNAYNQAQTELSYELKLALSAEVVNQDEFNDILEEIGENVVLGMQSGAEKSDVITADMREVIRAMLDRGFDISTLAEWGKDSGIDITDFLGNDFSEIFSQQLKNGYDSEDLLEWIGNSHKTIAKEAWDELAEYALKQLYDGINISELVKSGISAGVDWEQAFDGGYTGIVRQMLTEGLDPTDFIETMSKADKKASESFSENYMDIVQRMLNKGLDPTEMLLKMAESDKEMAEDFKVNGKDVMQKMLDKGFDFTELIKGFDIAITEIFNIYDEKFQKKFQKTLNTSSDDPDFLDWGHTIKAEKKTWEDLFGEDFEQYLEEYQYYLDAKNGRIQNNSAWEAELDREKRKKVGLIKYATGGYISSGNRGIVAESGPELLEVMNGGVRITPLTDSARNTSSDGSETAQRIFYNTYNINNPRISGYSDIQRIARDLAVEQRRNETGRGLR